jgi:hypothetical protein
MRRIKYLVLILGLVVLSVPGCDYLKSASPSCDSEVGAVKFFDRSKKGTPPLAFVAIGDSGCDCPSQRQVADRMLDWYGQHPYDFVLMLGDNIYGEDDTGSGAERLFAEYFDQYYGKLLDRGVKFHAVLGNHDVQAGDAKDQIKEVDRFGIMGESGYYTFTPANKANERPLVSFFGIDSNHFVSGRKDDVQASWLDRALSESKAIWKIAFFHHPLYTPNAKHGVDLGFRKSIEDILVSDGVQITLSGHNHFYARMRPQRSITHFTSGGGGGRLYKVGMNEITACASKSLHFMYMEVYPDEIRFWVVPTEGPPIDAGIINNEGKFVGVKKKMVIRAPRNNLQVPPLGKSHKAKINGSLKPSATLNRAGTKSINPFG